MAKFVPDAAMDAELAYIAEADIQHACTSQPANYAAIAAASVASVAMAGGDFAIADDTSGRKLTMAAKNNVTASASGDATHIVLAKTGDTTIRLITTCTLHAITSGNPVNFPSYKHNIPDPT